MSEYVSRVVGEDASFGYQIAVNNEGDAYYVTDCCGATAKGCDGYIGCRACYGEVDPGLGGIPDVEWFAPSQRERIRKFNEWEREMVRKSLAKLK